MEKKEPRHIYLPTSSFSKVSRSDNETGSEYQVIVLDDGVSFELNDVVTFVDEAGNPIIIRQPEQGELVVEIEQQKENNTDDQNAESENGSISKEGGQQSGCSEAQTSNENEFSVMNEQEEDSITNLLEELKESIFNENSNELGGSNVEDMEHMDISNESLTEQQESSNAHPSAEKPNPESFNDNLRTVLQQKKSLLILKQNCIEVVSSQEVPQDITGANEPMQLEPESEEWSNINQIVVDSGDNVCPLCKKVFKTYNHVKKHLKFTHARKATSNSKIHGLFLKCIECNLKYSTMEKLRDHLCIVHHLNMDCQELQFPNMNAFLTWKHEMERRDKSFFKIKRRVKAAIPKIFYICNRSGRYESYLVSKPRKFIMRAGGSYKMGIHCTATITLEDRPDGVYVKYWPHHYGHGKDSPSVRNEVKGPNSNQESPSFTNGIPFEELLKEIREKMTTDYHQLALLRKKDIKFIKNAFAAQEYSEGMSDSDSVDHWVQLCSQMEDSPVLYYRNEEYPEPEFMIVIMTEFQKHVLMASDKKVLSLDALFRRKQARFYFNCLCVVDENEVAYPVAYCISDKVDKDIIKIFLEAVKESTGPLSCSYFMSDWEKFYYEAWTETMQDNSRWLWSIWNMDTRIGAQVRCFKPDVPKRAEAYRTMRMLMECKDVEVFEEMFQKYVDWLMQDPMSQKFGKFVVKMYGNNKELWASCYHDIKMSSVISLEMLFKSLRYCSLEGRKSRLDKFLFVIIKLVRYKMILHLTNMLDEEKTGLAIEAINMCHEMGLEITTDRFSSLSDQIWLIRAEGDEEDVYITREFDTCPEHCQLRCSECAICVHMYSCSCMHNMINGNLCQHVHAIVYKFLTPQYSPMNSPARDDGYDEIENIEVIDVPGESTLKLMENVMKRTHDVYKKVRTTKHSLNQESLNDLMEHLNQCLNICSGEYVKVKKPEMSDKCSQTSSLGLPLANSLNVQPTFIQPILTNLLPENQQYPYVVTLQDYLNNGSFVHM